MQKTSYSTVYSILQKLESLLEENNTIPREMLPNATVEVCFGERSKFEREVKDKEDWKKNLSPWEQISGTNKWKHYRLDSSLRKKVLAEISNGWIPHYLAIYMQSPPYLAKFYFNNCEPFGRCLHVELDELDSPLSEYDSADFEFMMPMYSVYTDSDWTIIPKHVVRSFRPIYQELVKEFGRTCEIRCIDQTR